MELKDLIGKHQLSGVDMSEESIKDTWGEEYEKCQTLNFILDEKTYVAIEDPNDGYRSNMREIKETSYQVKNRFKPIEVLGKMRENEQGQVDEILDLIDTKTSKTVLSVGTANTDDYYPWWVAEFHPENMILNQKSE